MRILFIQPGIGTYRIDFFNELAKRCILKVIYFYDDSSGQRFPEPLASKLVGCEVEKVVGGFDLRGYYPVRPHLGKVISNFKPDVVVGYEYNTLMLHLVLLHLSARKKWKLFLWTSDNIEIATECKLFRRVFRWIGVQLSDGVLLYSSIVKDYYSVLFPSKNFLILPNIQSEEKIREKVYSAKNEAIDLSVKYDLSRKKVFLYVGRFHPVKNIPMLLESWKKAELNDSVLVLIGDGPENKTINRLVQDLKIKENTILTGSQYENSLWAWFLIGNVLILPSTFETYGAVINEALACGIPCIVSRHVGANVLISDHNGIVFKEDTHQCLSEALRKIGKTLKTSNDFTLDESLMPQRLDQFVDSFCSFLACNKSEKKDVN